MKIPTIKVPTYTMTLPDTTDPIKYRPFLVKEEKVLINAIEQISGEKNETSKLLEFIDAIGSVVSDCTDGKIDVEMAPMFDVQYAFLQIRGKSIGETSEVYLTCPTCGYRLAKSIHVNDFVMKHQTGHTKDIDLGDGTVITMRYPTMHHYVSLFTDDNEQSVYQVVSECIDKIVDPEQVFINDGSDKAGMLELVNNMTPEKFEKLEKFFETMPVLAHTINYTCAKCQAENSVTVDGIRNFFL